MNAGSRLVMGFLPVSVPVLDESVRPRVEVVLSGATRRLSLTIGRIMCRRTGLHSRPLSAITRCLPPSTFAERKGRVISPQRRSLLLVHCSLLVVAAIWGGTIPAIKYMLRTLEPIDVLLIRVGGAALIFAIILALQGKRAIPKSRRDGIELLLFGVLGIALMNLAMITGQDMIPAALASLIVTSNPVFTALVSRFLTGEPLTRRKIGGIALAFTGFLIVLFSGSGSTAQIDADQVKGILIVAIAPFSWAFYTVLTKPYLTRYEPANVAGYTAIGGFIGALPVLLFTDGTAARLGELGTTGWAIGFYLSAIRVRGGVCALVPRAAGADREPNRGLHLPRPGFRHPLRLALPRRGDHRVPAARRRRHPRRRRAHQQRPLEPLRVLPSRLRLPRSSSRPALAPKATDPSRHAATPVAAMMAAKPGSHRGLGGRLSAGKRPTFRFTTVSLMRFHLLRPDCIRVTCARLRPATQCEVRDERRPRHGWYARVRPDRAGASMNRSFTPHGRRASWQSCVCSGKVDTRRSTRTGTGSSAFRRPTICRSPTTNVGSHRSSRSSPSRAS